MAIFIDGLGAKGEAEDPGAAGRARIRRAAARLTRELHRAELLGYRAALCRELPPEVRTAVREACLRRILLLRSFLYPELAKAPDVRAADYHLEPAAWERARPVPGPLLRNWLDDLAPYVTPGPGPPPEGRVPEDAWPLPALVSAVRTAFNAFLEGLPHERRGWFAGGSGES